MAEDIRVEIRSESREEHRLLCYNCGGATAHRVLTGVYESGLEDEVPIQWWGQYEVVKCQGCRRISFREDTQNSEDEIYLGENRWKLVHHEKLYPPRIAGREELANLHFVPWKVQQVYRETHAALANGMKILGGIGVRALAEAVCKEKGAPGRKLDQQIDGLVQVGVLTAAGAEIPHGTRLLGNRAAHEQEELSLDLLNAAMEVAEHLLQTVYILPAIAANLPKRGSSQATGAGA